MDSETTPRAFAHSMSNGLPHPVNSMGRRILKTLLTFRPDGDFMQCSSIIRHLWVTRSYIFSFTQCLERLAASGMIEAVSVQEGDQHDWIYMVRLTKSSVDKVHSFIDGTLDKSDALYDSIECIIKYSQSAHH